MLLLVPFLLALTPGDKSPEFAAKNQNGKIIRFSDFKGKFLLIYFYPKDDTPGCTKEACIFRDEYEKIKKLNGVVLGVSTQDMKSHQQFQSKLKLPFDLLVDTDGKLVKMFGVGTYPLVGLVKRESILIGPNGKVVQYYKDVDPAQHVRQVIDDIQKNKSSKL